MISSASAYIRPERFEGLTLRSGPSSAARAAAAARSTSSAPGEGDLADRLAGGRVDGLEGAPVGRLDPLAADHQALRPLDELARGGGEGLGGGGGHRPDRRAARRRARGRADGRSAALDQRSGAAITTAAAIGMLR